MPLTEWGWLIEPEELRAWIVEESSELLVVNKPPHVLCHRSRCGPWSSLIGACREYLGEPILRMPFRLDRETSGVMIFARNREAGSRLQRAVSERRFRKTYNAIVCGELTRTVTVTGAIGADESAEFYSRRAIVPDGHGESAQTEFIPLAHADGYTWVQVHPHTGRRHQIRVHAASLGHSIAGDKLYGPDPGLMMRLVREGFSPELAAALPLGRHALHCSRVEFETEQGKEVFSAPLTNDLAEFLQAQLGHVIQLPIEQPPAICR